jgi:hypothetical protein
MAHNLKGWGTMRLAIKEVKTGNDSMCIIGEKYNIPASSI